MISSVIENLTVKWLNENRLQALDFIGALPSLIGWYVLIHGLITEGLRVVDSASFGSTLFLFSIFGLLLTATVAVTSGMRFIVSGLSPHLADVLLATAYIISLATFIVSTIMAGTSRPTGTYEVIALVAVFGATLSTAAISLIVLSRPLVNLLST